MKILQANKFFYPNGGSETVMFQEREFLLAHGHQVIDFSMADPKNQSSPYAQFFVSQRDYRTSNNAKWRQLADGLAMIHSPESTRNIRQLILQEKPDILHCHNIYHQLTPSIIRVAKSMGVKVVLTLHDYKLVCPTYHRICHGQVCSLCLDGNFTHVLRQRCADHSFFKSGLLMMEAYFHQWMRSYESVDAFIAPSQFMYDAIAHRVERSKLHYLPNGVTLRPPSSQEDDGSVLYIGRLVREKGVETLLKAFAMANRDWKLRVAGTGPLLDVLKTQYPQGIFMGHLNGDALSDVMKKAAVIIVPSEWYENCPMAVLEAMSYGKPVIASAIGGITELIQHGETGLLFEAGDAMGLKGCVEQLMQDSLNRQAMGNAGRGYVEQSLALDKHHQHLIKLYETIIEA